MCLGQHSALGPLNFAGLCGVFGCGVVVTVAAPGGAFGLPASPRAQLFYAHAGGGTPYFVKLVEVVAARRMACDLLGVLGMAGNQ